MRILKDIFDFYINSSIHVALGVVALTAVTCLHFNFELRPELLAFVFLGTITGYNFVKYAGIAQLYHRSLTQNLKLIQIFSLFVFLALFFIAFHIETEVILVAGVLGFITLLYAFPVFANKKNLREIAGLKVFVIAFIWAGATVLFPVADADFSLNWDVLTEFLQRFLFVLILILPFEIRDLKHDEEHLKTIPQRLGLEKAKILGYTLIAAWLGLEFLKSTATAASILSALATGLFTAFAIYKANEKRSTYFTSFWVEGIPLLWLGMLLLFGSF